MMTAAGEEYFDLVGDNDLFMHVKATFEKGKRGSRNKKKNFLGQ